jgi:hypothetical protein
MIERSVTFSISEELAVRAVKLASARKTFVPVHWLILAALAVCGAALALPRRSDGIVFDVLIPLVIFMVIVVALIHYLYIPWKAKQHFRQAASFRDEIALRWDAEWFHLKGERGSIDFMWSDFHRWSEDDKLLMLYHSDLLFNIVPKAALSGGQRDDIVNKLVEAGVKRR